MSLKLCEELWITRRNLLAELASIESGGIVTHKGHLSFARNPALAWSHQKMQQRIKALENRIAKECVINGDCNDGTKNKRATRVVKAGGGNSDKKVRRLPKR